MAAPTTAADPTAADPRLQAKLGNVNKTNATVITGKKGERSIIDDKMVTSETHTLYIGNCEDCDFIITAACTKVLVESCRKSRITLNGRIKTNVFEIWKCEDVTILINTHVFTIQADLCKKLTVEFTKKELHNQLVWGGVHDLKLSFRDAPDFKLETGYAQMKEVHPDLSDQTDQFIVRFVEGKLLQELIVRLKNGYPTTEREAAVFDENQRKKDEHMRREAEKLIKFVPKKYLKGDEPKVGRNEPCPCSSGKKYKACCGVAKKEEAKPAADAPKSAAAAPVATSDATAPTAQDAKP